MAELQESPPRNGTLGSISSHNTSFISEDTVSTFVRTPSASFSRNVPSPQPDQRDVDIPAPPVQSADLENTTKPKPNRRTARLFFAALCFLFLFQFAFVSGYTPSILSAVEVRYGFSSTQVAIILSAYDAGGLISAIPISYIGGSSASRIGHRPIWIGVAGLLMALASLIWALPDFFGGLYSPDDGMIGSRNGSNESFSSIYCVAGDKSVANSSCLLPSSNSSSSSNSAVSLAVFAIGHALSGMSAMAPLSLGPPYMQDGLNPASFAMYLGLLYSTTAIGPVLGFGLGAACQSLYVDVLSYMISGTPEDSAMTNMSPSNPAWVGAWWLGYVILAILLAASSIPFFFFPRSLADEPADELRSPASNASFSPTRSISSETALVNDKSEDDDNVLPSLNEAPRELAKAAWSLLKNPIWILNNIIFIAVSSPVNGFVAYLKKYMESMFGYSAPVASLLMGGILVPAAALGVMGGGFINKKFGANFARIATRHLLYACFACACLVIMMLVRCPNGVVGVHLPYFSQHKTDVSPLSPVGMVIGRSLVPVGLANGCNDNCACNPAHYDPICGSDGFTYFSGCYAGCEKPHHPSQSEGFSQCTCIANNTASLEAGRFSENPKRKVSTNFTSFGSAVAGACSVCMASSAIFLAVTFVATLSMSFGHNGTMLMLLRSIPRGRRALSLGLHNVLFKLFAAIPAPLLFGSAVDSACIFSSSASCKEQAPTGSLSSTGTYCLLYDADHLATAVFGLAFGYCGVAVIFLLFLFGYLTRERWTTLAKKYIVDPKNVCQRKAAAKKQCRRNDSNDDVGSTGDPLADAVGPCNQ